MGAISLLYDLQVASVNYWKNFGLDLSPMLDEIWIYPYYHYYFNQYTKEDGCFENLQYVTLQ